MYSSSQPTQAPSSPVAGDPSRVKHFYTSRKRVKKFGNSLHIVPNALAVPTTTATATPARRNALVKRKPSAGGIKASIMVAANPLPRTVRVILGGAQNHDTERGNAQRYRARPVVPRNLFGRDLAQVAHAGTAVNFGVRV